MRILFLVLSVLFASELLAQDVFEPTEFIFQGDTIPTQTTHVILNIEKIHIYDKLREVDINLRIDGYIKLENQIESYQTTCIENGLLYKVDIHYHSDGRTIEKIVSERDGSTLIFTHKEIIQ